MNIIKTILRFYFYGVLISLSMIGIVIAFKMITNPFYAFNQLNKIITTVLTCGIPFGALNYTCWTIKNMPKPKSRFMLTIINLLTYYWIGFIIGLLILCFTQLYIFVFNEPYHYASIENIMAFAIILGLPLAILVRIGEKIHYDSDNTIQ